MLMTFQPFFGAIWQGMQVQIGLLFDGWLALAHRRNESDPTGGTPVQRGMPESLIFHLGLWYTQMVANNGDNNGGGTMRKLRLTSLIAVAVLAGAIAASADEE